MIPAYIDKQYSFTEGEEWEGIPLITLSGAGNVIQLPVTAVHIQFLRPGQTPACAGYTVGISSEAGQVTIVDGSIPSISIPPIALPLYKGPWNFYIKIYGASSASLTVLYGSITVADKQVGS